MKERVLVSVHTFTYKLTVINCNFCICDHGHAYDRYLCIVGTSIFSDTAQLTVMLLLVLLSVWREEGTVRYRYGVFYRLDILRRYRSSAPTSQSATFLYIHTSFESRLHLKLDSIFTHMEFERQHDELAADISISITNDNVSSPRRVVFLILLLALKTRAFSLRDMSVTKARPLSFSNDFESAEVKHCLCYIRRADFKEHQGERSLHRPRRQLPWLSYGWGVSIP